MRTTVTRTTVWCTTRFYATHFWENAPEEVYWLKDLHHHEFQVRVEVAVMHNDREVEFIMLRREVDKRLEALLDGQDTRRWSCERWGWELGAMLRGDAYAVTKITVSEEGINGATVEWE